MLLTHAALFSPVELRHRVFTKVPRLQLRDRLLLLAQAGNPDVGNHVAKQIRLRELAAEGNPNPQIVVDALGAVAMANNAARGLFDLGPTDIGRPLKDLEISYKPVNLRAPIDQVFRDKRPVSLAGGEHGAPEGQFRQCDVQIVPLMDDDMSVVGVSVNFVDVTQIGQLRVDLERSKQEVETAYEELRSSNEKLETTNEELQSTVEELETTNEELQSSNEELETANEELETTNSELQAINSDIRARTDEVAQLNKFLLAITGKIPIAAVVLDADFLIQVWNEQAAEMWGLRSDEVTGESFFSLDIGLPIKEIRTMLRAVARGKPVSDELTVDATNRRGKPVKVRVLASTMPAGRKAGGLVMLIEELKNSKSSS